MAGGTSIFGKVAAVFAGLSGAAAPAQAGAPDSAPQQPAAITAEQELRSLRLVVREAGTAARRNQILSERGATSDDSVFAAPLAEGLELIVVADRGSTNSMWMVRDLKQYHLTAEAVQALARQQVLAVLPTLPPKEAVAGGAVRIPQTDYLASLMLADGWDALDRALGGQLIVAVPSDDVIIVADGAAADVRAMLPGFVEAQYADASRAVSPRLYRRENGAWVAVR